MDSDWGNTAQAATARLGSIGLKNGFIDFDTKIYDGDK